MEEAIKKKLENDANEYLRKWSILDDAEKLVKEYGITDVDSIYQTKSYYASRFVSIQKKLQLEK